MPNNLLLTGRPGIGKTTVIRKVVERLGAEAGGFYTEEVRLGRERIGFRIVTLDRQETWLAYKDWPSPYRIGKYGVNLQGFEELAIPTLRRALARAQVILVDEIGPMELLSPAFIQMVSDLLDHTKPLVATIMARSHPWTDAVKARVDVEVWEVTRSNRDTLPDRILEWLAKRRPQGGAGTVFMPHWNEAYKC